MKSIHHGNAAANLKLKGKLEKLLPCKCCVMQNWKWRERVREAIKEMRKI